MAFLGILKKAWKLTAKGLKKFKDWGFSVNIKLHFTGTFCFSWLGKLL